RGGACSSGFFGGFLERCNRRFYHLNSSLSSFGEAFRKRNVGHVAVPFENVVHRSHAPSPFSWLHGSAYAAHLSVVDVFQFDRFPVFHAFTAHTAHFGCGTSCWCSQASVGGLPPAARMRNSIGSASCSA